MVNVSLGSALGKIEILQNKTVYFETNVLDFLIMSVRPDASYPLIK